MFKVQKTYRLMPKETAVRHAVLDSQSMVRVYFSQGEVNGWTLDFKDAGAATLVELRTINFGRGMIIDRLRPQVEACAVIR